MNEREMKRKYTPTFKIKQQKVVCFLEEDKGGNIQIIFSI